MKAEGIQALAWLLVALPLAGAAVLLLGGRRTDRWGHLLGVAMSLASFVVGLAMFVQMLGYGPEERRRTIHLWEFLNVGSFKVDMGLLVDPLSISFVLLITGVGTLIHVYSIGYMEHDPDRRRFFAYLNLFVAAMLLLVLGDNYLAMFIGWEGVGLASYLLIGFWQYKPTAAVAAKKAFVVNRVGDMGFLIAIMLMFGTFGTVGFEQILGEGAEHPGLAAQLSTGTATALGLLLLVGACGKSAQLPLQSWLLDAMEGPTPVSALIHAATMVTAGVYLIVRSAAIFEMSPDAQLVVTIVGAATLIAGAVIGTGKDDIKKALNMRHYGALRGMMVVTWATFGLGYLAIIGFPGLSGWFTKDGIIEAAFEKGGTSGAILGACALIGAGITAYYMSRVMFMTFFGKERWEEGVHPHESPKVMTVPLILLAVGSIFAGGFLVLGGFSDFLAPVVGEPEHHGFHPITGPGVATFVLMLIGVGIAWRQYGARPVPREAPAGSFLTVAARKDLYGDAINESLLMRPGQWLTRLAVWFDGRGVDGLVNGLAAGVGGSSGRVRRIQTGFVRSYALSMFFGAAIIVAALLVVNV
jgi:NADH-quinone oxidoreductase subunit L